MSFVEGIGSPETMDVAVGVDRYRLILGAAEGNLRTPIRVGEIVDLSTMFGLEIDKLDVVILCHRVWGRSYADEQRVVVGLRDDGEVTLTGRIDRRFGSMMLLGMRNQQLHLAPATNRNN